MSPGVVQTVRDREIAQRQGGKRVPTRSSRCRLPFPRRPPADRRDDGASAVEFALVLPLLMLFLFGIIQYGYGLFQLQALTATVDEAAKRASTGLTTCQVFRDDLVDLAGNNGLDQAAVEHLEVDWISQYGGPSTLPDLLGQVRVLVRFEPFDIGIPFVPFPDEITRVKTAPMQSILNPDLLACDLDV